MLLVVKYLFTCPIDGTSTLMERIFRNEEAGRAFCREVGGALWRGEELLLDYTLQLN